MSEKRFQLNNNVAHNIRQAASIIGLNLDYVSHLFIDNKNGRKYLTPHEIVDLLNSLSEENEQLRQQLQCNKMSKSVCSVCKNHRLEQVSDMYYVSKCEKGHNECSKTMLRCCEDFEVLNDE